MSNDSDQIPENKVPDDQTTTPTAEEPKPVNNPNHEPAPFPSFPRRPGRGVYYVRHDQVKKLYD